MAKYRHKSNAIRTMINVKKSSGGVFIVVSAMSFIVEELATLFIVEELATSSSAERSMVSGTSLMGFEFNSSPHMSSISTAISNNCILLKF
ncbi:MAG: hypothetical protein II398_04645, partial [Prevotella sp.]|nr:hypothetical protein [Prevotella sp.]